MIKITLVFLFAAVFAAIATVKMDKREAAKPNLAVQQAAAENLAKMEQEIELKKKVPIDKFIKKQQRRLEKINREAEMGLVPGTLPPKVKQQQVPIPGQPPKLKYKASMDLMTAEQYDAFLKEKARKRLLKRHRMLLSAEQLINQIEMLDSLECCRSSQAENCSRLISGGLMPEQCREPSEMLRTLKERLEALQVKENENKVWNDICT